MAAGRDRSSSAQHPPPGKPRETIIATAKEQITHHLNAPVPAPGLVAARACGAESSTAS